MDSYLSISELKEMHFSEIGEDVRISRRAALYNTENMKIGNHVRIDDFTFISGGKGISIGDYVHIATYSALYGKFGIEIGDYVNISNRVTIFSSSDDYSGQFLCGPLVEQQYVHDIGKKIIIEEDVIIGAGCVLLPGAVIRQGVAVGAMSLVKQELEPFGIYAGIPVRYIKERSREMLEKKMLNN